MNIAMDWDDTFTADPECMLDIISLFRLNGHKVYIVTMRCPEQDFDEQFKSITEFHSLPIVFCDGKPKKDVIKEQGIWIDIWIDDTPEGIHKGSTYTPEELKKWRDDNKKKAA